MLSSLGMLEPISLEFEVLPGGPGWASCIVRSGERYLKIGHFSHALSEGLDDLVRATTCIVSGAWEQVFSMDDEPEPKWQWRLRRKLIWQPNRYELEISIRRIDDVATDAGEDVFASVCDPDDFGRAVLQAMKGVMSREPPESLRIRWSHFPIRAMAALGAALAVPLDPD